MHEYVIRCTVGQFQGDGGAQPWLNANTWAGSMAMLLAEFGMTCG